ncbi:TonB-dependent receptor [Herminiimonas sp. CN]|uniref:TonB-dependent receptor family protein n=1 Tax=Herminiimonas sp. CN TaxID=1349818 RepID=UPI00047305C9|nr:TonB-dependent receptor [Herminiimonas sp. CN]
MPPFCPPLRLTLLAAAAAAFAASACAADSSIEDAAAAVKTLAPVVVTGSRFEHSSFDLPASVDVLDQERITSGQARVNASEALAAVPGLVVQNRQNYAQDLQISSRGFGARSAFGVRGVQLFSDGIPATMPDGQGQAATFNLDMAQRIEVLRGPFSAIYGNHAGGVIQLFTRDGQGAPSVQASVLGGSDGSWKTDLSAQGKPGAVGYVLDASRFHTDGARDHSAATRDQAFAKITTEPDADSRLTLVANGLWQHDTQDPLGVSWATFQRDPRAGEIDPSDTQNPKRTFAERYNTRKSIDHQQLGLTYERRFGADLLQLTAYAGNRQVTQYQSFSKGFQAPASHSGGVVDFDRNFGGVDLHWIGANQLGSGSLTTTVGLDYGRSSDDRQGYENFIGSQFGVKGKLRRDETDTVTSLDPYLQTEWQSGDWVLTAGLRHSRMQVEVNDSFISNGNDSGSLNYRRTTPVLALLYKATPALNLYASAAKGFETPTLNELFYSGSGSGFNFNLKPAHSTHLEVGTKALLGSDTQLNVALFQVRTDDELVVDASSGGRTSYKNAGSTLRQGIELALDTKWQHGFSGRLALTGLYAVYDQTVGNIAAGNRLPGVPRATLFGELAWKDTPTGLSAAIEAIANSKVYVEDSNTETAAPGYGAINLRTGAEQHVGAWRLQQFVRINNLLDRSYIGSVIVGDSNKRYYEPAPGRNWMLGASAQYVF